jgi:mRNA-degrading endonuclease toxin of MazEF toxin-antitoxin module
MGLETGKARNGNPKRFEANMPKRCVINVSQIKSVDRKSIKENIGALSEKRMAEVYQGLRLVMSIP